MTNKQQDYFLTSENDTESGIIVEPIDAESSQDQIRRLRALTGLNRKEFCKYLDIPYRTMTEWEKGGRTMPDYVLRLIEYKLRTEKMLKGLEE